MMFDSVCFRSVLRVTFIAAFGLLLGRSTVSPAQAADDAPKNLVANGGFEDGVKGWMYHQWTGKKVPGKIETTDKTEGDAAFMFHLDGESNGRYMAKEVHVESGKDYVLSFAIKTVDVPKNAARVRVSIDKRGWLGARSGHYDLVKLSGSNDWQMYNFNITAGNLGQSTKLTIFFYHDKPDTGTIGIDNVRMVEGHVDSPSQPAANAETHDDAPREEDAKPQAALPDGELVSNGGFEKGVSGWMYHQWVGKSAPGKIDRTDKAEGDASFKLHDDSEDRRTLAKEVHLADPSKDHVVTMWLKADDMPFDAAVVRVSIDGHGWLGSRMGKPDQLKLGGTVGWRRYGIALPARELKGSKKVTIFIYDNASKQGTLGIDGVSVKQGKLADVDNLARPLVLKGDTSAPENSFFAVGQPVQLKFSVSGIGEDTGPLSLDLSFVDEHDKPLGEKKITVEGDDKGNWKTTVDAPHDHLGFYRVRAALSNGVQLEPLGSRPAGYLTYIVVPDPAKRVDYGERNRFAMQGGPYHGDGCKMLGIRWVLDDGLFWKRTEPHHAGEFGPEQIAKYASHGPVGTDDYRIRTLNTLYVAPKWAVIPETLSYNTGTLTPDGEKAWEQYCIAAAKAYIGRYPDRTQHIFQITWEPNQPWGFKGTDKDIVRIYQIAYKALHDTDPQAVVAGPTRGITNNGDPAGTERLFKLGLAKYIDAYTVHPYFDIHPDREGMVQAIRTIKDIVAKYAGKDLPLYGTEQGWSTHEDPADEITQARGLMRQNLITLGEGFAFNFAFTFYDYRLAGQKGYGYNYNLESGVPFGTKKTAPKPVTAAYAAQSYLLEGSDSVGPIEWLGDKIRGYAFQRPDGTTTLALWCYADQPRQIQLPTGAADAKAYDWMGNALSPQTDATGQRMQLTLSTEPTYVQGVSPTMWGRESVKVFAVASHQITAYPGDTITLTGRAQSPGDADVDATLTVADATLAVPSARKTVTLHTNSATEFSIPVKLPAQLPPGQRILAVMLDNDQQQMLAATGVTVDVQSPIAVQLLSQYTDNGLPAVAIQLTNQRDIPMTGSIHFDLKRLLPGVQRSDAPMIDLVTDPGKAVDVPNTDKQVAFDVSAGGSKRLVVPLENVDVEPARPYQVLATVDIDQGMHFSQTQTVHFLGAVRQSSPPTIDGDLADWPDGMTVKLAGPHDVVRNPAAYNPAFSAQLRYAWDAKNLYIAVKVDDNVFIQNNTGPNTWRQDCLQLAFNLDPDATAADQRRTCEINVALTPDGPQAFRSLSYAPVQLPTGPMSADQFHAAVHRSGSGDLVYEIAIPWTSLGASANQTFNAGDAISVAVTVNEVRNASQHDPCALGLFGGITPNKSPDAHGRLILQ